MVDMHLYLDKHTRLRRIHSSRRSIALALDYKFANLLSVHIRSKCVMTRNDQEMQSLAGTWSVHFVVNGVVMYVRAQLVMHGIDG